MDLCSVRTLDFPSIRMVWNVLGTHRHQPMASWRAGKKSTRRWRCTNHIIIIPFEFNLPIFKLKSDRPSQLHNTHASRRQVWARDDRHQMHGIMHARGRARACRTKGRTLTAVRRMRMNNAHSGQCKIKAKLKQKFKETSNWIARRTYVSFFMRLLVSLPHSLQVQTIRMYTLHYISRVNRKKRRKEKKKKRQRELNRQRMNELVRCNECGWRRRREGGGERERARGKWRARESEKKEWKKEANITVLMFTKNDETETR